MIRYVSRVNHLIDLSARNEMSVISKGSHYSPDTKHKGLPVD